METKKCRRLITRLSSGATAGCLAFITMACIGYANSGDIEFASIQHDTKAANDGSLSGHIVRDPKRIAQVYTDDAVIFPGGENVIKGYDAILKYYQDGLSGSGRALKIDTKTLSFDVIGANNAVQSGRYSILYQRDSISSPYTVNGTMLIVWKRIDGNWKIYLDMWH